MRRACALSAAAAAATARNLVRPRSYLVAPHYRKIISSHNVVFGSSDFAHASINQLIDSDLTDMVCVRAV